MIYEALKIIQDELNIYLKNTPLDNQNGEVSLLSASEDVAVLGNISRIDDASNSSLESKVVITLVNVEEEKILKNNPHYKSINNTTFKSNPVVYLNCYVLFTANFGIADSQGITIGYDDSLRYLSAVVAFFQKKYVFDRQNTPNLDNRVEKLIVDIHTLNFEYLNHLWGILGGKYLPSVLYKVRLIPIEADSKEPISVITGIETREN